MSAQPILPSAKRAGDNPGTSFAPMQLSDVPEVAAIERTIYTAPWTEGNFVDSLNAGYCAWTLRSTDRLDRDRKMIGRHPIIGYFVLMAAVDEAHLLNVSIATPWQSRGHGLYLLRQASAVAIEYKASSIILEVRPSNLRALSVYRHFGFREHGLRRRYYPASSDDHQAREDAIVMRLQL